MKKIVRLTENDLRRIVKRVMNEGAEGEHVIMSMDNFLKDYKGQKGSWRITDDGYVSIDVQDPNNPKRIESIHVR